MLTIKALGGFKINNGRDIVAGFTRARVKELLVYLLLQPGQQIPRSQIAFHLWPETSQKQAFSNLRNLLYCLNQGFQDHDHFIDANNQTITWIEDSRFWFDVSEYKKKLGLAAVEITDRKRIQHLEEAVRLYRGDLLPCNFSNWLLDAREDLAQSYTTALRDLIALYESLYQYAPAIKYANLLFHRDPLHEPNCAQLMRLHALGQNRTAAIKTYQFYRSLLHEELGVTPSRSLNDLHEQLLMYDSNPISKTTNNRLQTMVGREKSWKELLKAWQKAYQEPQLVVITGENGIGKTHLAEAFVDEMSEQGVFNLITRCFAPEARLAFAPIISWLQESRLENLDSNTLSELSHFLHSKIKNLPHNPKSGPIVEDWQRFNLFKAFHEALIKRHKSLIIFLDDYHLCDLETLHWLYYLFSSHHLCFAQPQLLILTTTNSTYPDILQKIPSWKSQLNQKNSITTIQLDRLNSADTIKLANRINNHALHPRLERRLFKHTEGNPFFIVELITNAVPTAIRHMKPNADMSMSTPNSVICMYEAQLAQLSQKSRNVIEQAAIIGREFNYRVLTQLVNLNEKALVDCLDECWRCQVIREKPKNTYLFSHNQLHQIAYEGISLTRRRWLHRQVAIILESLHADQLGQFAGVIANHYEKAGFIEEAISYYDHAAQAASQVYAHKEALAALIQATSLLDQIPHEDIYQEYYSEFQERIGDINGLNAHFNGACKAYQTALNQTPETKTLKRSRLILKMGSIHKNMGVNYQAISELYQQAGDLLSQPTLNRDHTWWEAWCNLQLEKMDLHYLWQKPVALENQLQNVRDEVETHGTHLQKSALNKQLMFYLVMKNRFIATIEAVQYAHNALESLPESTKQEIRISYQFGLGFSQLWYRDYEKANSILQEAFRLSQQCRDVVYQSRCLAYLILAYRLTDQQIEVEKTIQTCLTISEQASLSTCIGVCLAGLAWLNLKRSDHKTFSTSSLNKAKHLAKMAMKSWKESKRPYPFQWQALWPLLHIAMIESQTVDALYCARQLCNPTQQAQYPEIEDALTKALAAWTQGNRMKTREMLHRALKSAHQKNLI